MPKVICKTSCYFSQKLTLFNQGEAYDIPAATWKKMQEAGMEKYFEVQGKGKPEPAEKPEPAAKQEPAEKPEPATTKE